MIVKYFVKVIAKLEVHYHPYNFAKDVMLPLVKYKGEFSLIYMNQKP